jgi:hypothetical protein
MSNVKKKEQKEDQKEAPNWKKLPKLRNITTLGQLLTLADKAPVDGLYHISGNLYRLSVERLSETDSRLPVIQEAAPTAKKVSDK